MITSMSNKVSFQNTCTCFRISQLTHLHTQVQIMVATRRMAAREAAAARRAAREAAAARRAARQARWRRVPLQVQTRGMLRRAWEPLLENLPEDALIQIAGHIAATSQAPLEDLRKLGSRYTISPITPTSVD